ncbi:hypothetical protein Tco_0098803 [Tanacetum coccineum]
MEPQTNPVVDPLGTNAKYQVDQTQSTRLSYRSLTENKGKTSSEVESDTEALQLKTFADVQALLLSDDEMSPLNTDKPELSPAQDTQESDSDSSSLELKKYDNNVVKDDPTLNNKLIEATKAYTKNLTALTEMLTLVKNFNFQGLKSSVEFLQATAIKQEENLASWVTSSTSMAWNLGPRMTVRFIRPSKVSLPPPRVVYHKQHLRSLEGQQLLGENVTPVVTKEPPSYTEGETEEPKHVVLISTVKPTETLTLEVQPITTVISTSQPEPSVPKIEGKGIATDDQPEVHTKLVKASSIMRLNPDAPILVPYMINGKLFYLTEE